MKKDFALNEQVVAQVREVLIKACTKENMFSFVNVLYSRSCEVGFFKISNKFDGYKMDDGDEVFFIGAVVPAEIVEDADELDNLKNYPDTLEMLVDKVLETGLYDFENNTGF